MFKEGMRWGQRRTRHDIAPRGGVAGGKGAGERLRERNGRGGMPASIPPNVPIPPCTIANCVDPSVGGGGGTHLSLALVI